MIMMNDTPTSVINGVVNQNTGLPMGCVGSFGFAIAKRKSRLLIKHSFNPFFETSYR